MASINHTVSDMVITQFAPGEEKEELNDHRTHIINPATVPYWRQGITSIGVKNIAITRGASLVALCGYRFEPVKGEAWHPDCETCVAIAQVLERATY